MTVPTSQPLDAIRKAWRSAFGSRKVAYLSGPITTGLRFIDWWSETGHRLVKDTAAYTEGLRNQVIAPNENQLKVTPNYFVPKARSR